MDGDLLLTAHGRHESATNETLISLIEKGVHGDAVIVTELGGKDLPITGMGLVFWELRIAGDEEGIHETVAEVGAPHAVMAGYRVFAACCRRKQQNSPTYGIPIWERNRFS